MVQKGTVGGIEADQGKTTASEEDCCMRSEAGRAIWRQGEGGCGDRGCDGGGVGGGDCGDDTTKLGDEEKRADSWSRMGGE